MTTFMTTVADRMLARIAPKAEAAAACSYSVYCYCSFQVKYYKTCYQCPGVPYYCTACTKRPNAYCG